MLVTWAYDNLLLFAVFKVYLPYIWGWIVVVLPAIMLTPGHRRTTQALLVLLFAWHVAGVVAWDFYYHAAAATWVICGALAVRLAIFGWYVVPHGWFSTGMLRRYVQFDPACSYLMDAARTRRGIAALHEAKERRKKLPEYFDISRLHVRMFQAVVSGFDLLIRLYEWLPRYWKMRHVPIHLDQPHVWAVLKAEAAQTKEVFRDLYHGTSLADYRKLGPLEKREQDTRIRALAERLVRLYEAMVQYQAFRRPLPTGAHDRVLMAYQLNATAWRFRCQYDTLWCDTNEQRGADGGALDAGAERVSPGSSDTALTDTGATPSSHSSDAMEGEVDSLLALTPSEDDADAPPDEAVPTDTEPCAEELFDLVAALSQPDEAACSEPEDADGNTLLTQRRFRERNSNLVDACACLEALLALESPATLAKGIENARKAYRTQQTRSKAIQLLAMYCARFDWTGSEAERLRLDVIESLLDDVVHGTTSEPSGSPSKRGQGAAMQVLVDLLMTRHDYARVRSLHAEVNDFDPSVHAVLGEACAGLANQIGVHEELRDMLRYEAIDHFYRAGKIGVWRRQIAETLVGETDSQESLIRLLDQYPVEATAGLTIEAPPIKRPSPTKPKHRPAAPSSKADDCARRALCRLKPCATQSAGPILIVPRPSARLGRGDVDVRLEDQDVSRSHCKIELVRTGNTEGVLVQDLRSRNGTFVNGAKIGEEPVLLRSGDRLRVGNLEFEVICDD